MIDLDALVIGTAQTFYARPITVTPLVSQPGIPPFDARGIWRSKPVDVDMVGDGPNSSILSSQENTLDTRASEFPIPLLQGDQIEIDAHLHYPRVGVCLVEDTDDDGEGSTLVSLRIVGP